MCLTNFALPEVRIFLEGACEVVGVPIEKTECSETRGSVNLMKTVKEMTAAQLMKLIKQRGSSSSLRLVPSSPCRLV